MGKHTPGPWFVEDNPTIFPAVQVSGFEDSGNRHLQVVIYSNSQEADARLIASAPDLLEALSSLVRSNEEHNARVSTLVGRPTGWHDGYLNSARAAIAKAKGDA